MARKWLAVTFVIVFIIVGALVSVALLYYGRQASCASAVTYQYENQRPPGGILIVANDEGYNDSVDHGVPANSWPVVNASKCSTVTITVCDTDIQAHGFQISHYFDNSAVSIAPGQCLTVSFVADVTGNFRIYCNIFCTVHWAMQSGVLNVS